MSKEIFYGILLYLIVMSAGVHAETLQRPDLDANDRKRVSAVTTHATTFSVAEKFESMQAGAATSRAPVNTNAFSHMQANLQFADRESFNLGNALFRKLWVSSPSSTLASDGLGPLFNARSCQGCHIKDGRGNLPGSEEPASSFLIQLGSFNTNLDTWQSDPTYGAQLQTSAVPGHAAEGRIKIRYTPRMVRFDDGDEIELRVPDYDIENPGYGPLGESTRLSPRIAPAMIGMGLLEAIHESDIISLADPEDTDADGISGRVSRDVSNADAPIGRFGLKAAKSSVLDQVAQAFLTDMGLSSPLHSSNSGDCTPRQIDCLKAPDGEQQHLGVGEVPKQLLELVAFYSGHLAPPSRRDVDSTEVLAGKRLFYSSGCADCHTPKFVTSREAELPQHRFQLIWPYTDLLLHDMGEELADGVGHDGGATGSEWRTAPLWGIGLTKTVNPRATFLHDGRARTLLEATLWHGGEGAKSQAKVLAMSRAERRALIMFLESL